MRKSLRAGVPRHKGYPRRAIRRTPRNPRRQTYFFLAVAIVGAGILSAVLVVNVLQAKRNLDTVQAQTDILKSEAKNKDFAALKQSLGEVSSSIADANAATNSFVWRLGELVPVAGANLHAVRIVTNQTGQLIDSLALPGLELLPADGELPKDGEGNIDFTFVNQLDPLAEAAQTVVPQAQRELQAAKSPFLIPQVSHALEKISSAVSSIEPMAENATGYAKVIRAFLGMDAPVTVALVAQNNAEAAALGGNSEHITIMSIDKGRVETQQQISQRDMPIEAVDSPVPQETLDLHTNVMLTWANAATFRPDFPTAATLLTEHLDRTFGIKPDIFVSIDPIALSLIIAATGDITLETGDVLTPENTVATLLNDVYLRYPEEQISEETDIFFDSAATEILTALKTGDFDFGKMVTAITDGINQGSIMMWFRDQSLQDVISGAPIAGTLASTNDPNTEVGVYFRDNSSSKVDYYLETNVDVTGSSCSNQATTEISLHSNLTIEQANALPSYVRGGIYRAEFFRTEVYVYAPIGAIFDSLDIVQSSKTTELAVTGSDLGRNVAKFVVDLRPGETAVIKATMSGASSPSGPIKLRTTPMINGTSSISQDNCG